MIFTPFAFMATTTTDPGLNIPTSGLYAWWDFNNPSSYTAGGSTVTDLSGNGNDGAVGSSITTGLDGSVRYIQASGGGSSNDGVDGTTLQATGLANFS